MLESEGEKMETVLIENISKDIALSKFPFTEFENHILLGSLLGDMHAAKEFRNTRVEESHGIAQYDYLKWKFDNLSSLDSKLKKYIDPRRDKEYCKFWSKTSPNLNVFHNIFYGSGKKTITADILSNLNKISLAVWYCDDGDYDYENHQVSFHTESFSKDENVMLKNWFYDNFKFKGNLKKVRKYHCFRLDVESSNSFLQLVEDVVLFMPSSMHYKLGHLKNENLGKIEDTKKKKKIRMKIYQQREDVKKKKNDSAKKHYVKFRDKILESHKTVSYRKMRAGYMKKYYKRAEVKLKKKKYDKNRRSTVKFKNKFREYQREYRKRKKEGGFY